MPIPKLILIPDNAALDLQDDDSARVPASPHMAGNYSPPNLFRCHSSSAALDQTRRSCSTRFSCADESCIGVRRWQTNGSCTCESGSAEDDAGKQLPPSSQTQNGSLKKKKERRKHVLRRTNSLPAEDKPPRMPKTAFRRSKTSILEPPPRYSKGPTAPSA